MREHWLYFTMHAAERGNRRKGVEWREAAARERDRMQDEALGLDRGCSIAYPCRYMHFEPGVTCCACHRQAMGQKSPIFRHHIEQPWLGRTGSRDVLTRHIATSEGEASSHQQSIDRSGLRKLGWRVPLRALVRHCHGHLRPG